MNNNNRLNRCNMNRGTQFIKRSNCMKNNKEFEKKIEELYKYINNNNIANRDIYNNNIANRDISNVIANSNININDNNNDNDDSNVNNNVNINDNINNNTDIKMNDNNEQQINNNDNEQKTNNINELNNLLNINNNQLNNLLNINNNQLNNLLNINNTSNTNNTNNTNTNTNNSNDLKLNNYANYLKFNNTNNNINTNNNLKFNNTNNNINTNNHLNHLKFNDTNKFKIPIKYLDNKIYEKDNIILSYTKKNIIYGIKKTISSDLNHLYLSSNSNDFKIGLNKNNKPNLIFDCFYLYPNISEINTKIETNYINDKIVKKFGTQYFPLDFIPSGTIIPLKTNNKTYSKLIISNIYWNIFQSIKKENYSYNELLCYVPDRIDFVYKSIKLQIDIELHSQINNNILSNNILPYRNDELLNITPANTCIYRSVSIELGNLNGSYLDNIEINLLKELDLECCLLCLKISVPDYSSDILKGFDKNNKIFCGYIPFSQMIINLDYELI